MFGGLTLLGSVNMWLCSVKVLPLIVCISAIISCIHGDAKISITSDGHYSVSVNAQKWLDSAHTFFQVNGQKYTTLFGNLKIANVSSSSGKDVLGNWCSTDFMFVADSTRILGKIKEYADYPLVVFEQHFIDGAQGTSVGNPNYVVSGFPAVQIGTQDCMLGYFGYGGMMLGDTTKNAGLWTNETTGIRDGIADGPIALFDKSDNVLIISAFNEFMAAGDWHDTIFGGNINWGIMGLVDTIPKGFVLKTGIFYGSNGINKAFEDWGNTLRTLYNKKLDYMHSDLIVNYLGYWTDNGAYYYYSPEPNKTLEATLYDVIDYAKQMNIPYRYIQYDSWWYEQGPLTGAMTWHKAKPSIFPHGLKSFYNNSGLPVIAHNRWWSSLTPYAKQNGGPFHFEMDLLKSVPNDQSFWDWLFQETKKWGLITYEQDWMNVEFLGVKPLLTDITLGRKWLMQMGEAARKTGMTLQYCMSNTRHGMQSLEIPTVTQIRVSDDYSPGQNNWKIGVTSLYAYALGLAPYKDSFWTTVSQPGNPYGREETYPALNAAASVLSSGLVGPADAVGKTNVSLLMRCCNTDGLILKPSKPVTAIDAQFQQMAFGDGSGPRGEVWTTYSVVSGLHFGTIFAAQLNGTFSMTPANSGFSQFPPSYVFMDNPMQAGPAAMFDEQHPLVLARCILSDFCLYHVTPKLSLGGKQLLLYGEISKWVPMSYKRVRSVAMSTDDVTVTLTGGVGEQVAFWVNLDNKPMRIDCTISQAGTAILSVAKQQCSSR